MHAGSKTPQYCVLVTGRHRSNGLTDILSFAYDRDRQIVMSKYIRMADCFSAMIAVWMPPTDAIRSARSFETLLMEKAHEDPRLLGFEVTVTEISERAWFKFVSKVET